jgi:chromosome condensin MukBEF ATPase and DNA-binding subunit MukB
MSENPPNEPDLGDELHNLGKNLSDFLRAAWASEERKRVQQDIESSLTELGKTIDKAANDFSASETGQRLKSDIHDFQKRVETGEVQQKARRELLEALKKVNQELTKAANKWGATSPSSSQTTSGEGSGGPAEGAGK